MSALLALAAQRMGPSLRQRVLPAVLAYGALCLFLGPTVADLSLGDPHRALLDVGCTLAWAVGLAVAVVEGARVIAEDLQSRQAVALLICPISRSTYTAGRLLGLFGTLAVTAAGLGLVGALVGGLLGVSPSVASLWMMGLLWVEWCVVGALTALLSSWVSPAQATLSGAALAAVGHLVQEVGVVATVEGSRWLSVAIGALSVVLPDLDVFNIQAQVVYGDAIDPIYGCGALLYGALWLVGLVSLTTWVMTVRDIS